MLMKCKLKIDTARSDVFIVITPVCALAPSCWHTLANHLESHRIPIRYTAMIRIVSAAMHTEKKAKTKSSIFFGKYIEEMQRKLDAVLRCEKMKEIKSISRAADIDTVRNDSWIDERDIRHIHKNEREKQNERISPTPPIELKTDREKETIRFYAISKCNLKYIFRKRPSSKKWRKVENVWEQEREREGGGTRNGRLALTHRSNMEKRQNSEWSAQNRLLLLNAWQHCMWNTVQCQLSDENILNKNHVFV